MDRKQCCAGGTVHESEPITFTTVTGAQRHRRPTGQQQNVCRMQSWHPSDGCTLISDPFLCQRRVVRVGNSSEAEAPGKVLLVKAMCFISLSCLYLFKPSPHCGPICCVSRDETPNLFLQPPLSTRTLHLMPSSLPL